MPDAPAGGEADRRLRDILADSDAVTRRAGEAATPSTRGVREARKDPDRIVGEYVLLREAGHGGMGTVWQAWDETLQRDVAIKFLGGATGAEGLDRERFLREARTLARLRHPHIVAVYGFGFRGEVPYIVMEWVDGVPLDRWADVARPAGEAVALLAGPACWVAQVASALEYAHRQGFIHRDVKPSNILLERPAGGAPPVARLIDFGLARDVLARPGLVTLHGRVGTPFYMSPEQFAGDSTHIGPAADVYGLGATLYHLVTGEPPRYDEVEGRPLLVPPRRVRAAIDPRIEGIILKAMRPDPSERYGDMGALRRDLEAFLARAGPRRRLRLLLGAALAAAMAIGAVIAWRWPREERPPAPAPVRDAAGIVAEAEAISQLSETSRRDALLEEARGALDCELATHPGDAGRLILRARLLRLQGDFGDDAQYLQAIEALRGLTGPAAVEERLRATFRLHLAPYPDFVTAPEEGIAACREAEAEARTTPGVRDETRALADALAAYWKDGPPAGLAAARGRAGSADLLLFEAALLRYEGHPDESPGVLARAVEREPFLRVGWQLLIEAQIDQGDLSTAKQQARALAVARPDEPLWLYDQALVRLAGPACWAVGGDVEGAIEDLRALRARFPEHVRILGDLAVLTLVQGDLAAARPLLEAYVGAAGRPWAGHAHYHMNCLEVIEALRGGSEDALAEAVARFARVLTPDENAGEGYYSWVPDWSDPSTRFGFAFPLTAGAVRTDPLLAPLRDREDSWAPLEKVLSPPEK